MRACSPWIRGDGTDWQAKLYCIPIPFAILFQFIIRHIVNILSGLCDIFSIYGLAKIIGIGITARRRPRDYARCHISGEANASFALKIGSVSH